MGKLSDAAKALGMSVNEMLELADDGDVTGICRACGAIYEGGDLEPDADDCTCETCGAERVASCLVIAGVI